jgi:hypothetical protein
MVGILRRRRARDAGNHNQSRQIGLLVQAFIEQSNMMPTFRNICKLAILIMMVL